MKKKGSHVGVILSFVVFITFLIFIFSVLEPAVRIEREKVALLAHLRAQIIQESYNELETFTIQVTGSEVSPSQVCYSIQNLVDGFLVPEGINESHLIIKDHNEVVRTYAITGGDKKLEVYTGAEFIGFLKFFHTDLEPSICLEKKPGDCTPPIKGCRTIQEGKYTFGQIRNENETFFTDISGLILRYDTDYPTFKGELGIPEGSDFTFSFTDNLGVLSEPSTALTPPEGVDVFADEFPLLYVDEQASIESGFLNIRIW